MMEERYHATTQNRFYLAMSKVNRKYYREGKTYQPIYAYSYLYAYISIYQHNGDVSPANLFSCMGP